MGLSELAPDASVDIVPVLPTLNLAQTRDFYLHRLGFVERPVECDEYLIICHQRLELHFSLTHDPGLCFHSSVFFRIADAQRLYEDFVGRGIEAIRPSERGAGGHLFHIRDPHGNLLIFADNTEAKVSYARERMAS